MVRAIHSHTLRLGWPKLDKTKSPKIENMKIPHSYRFMPDLSKKLERAARLTGMDESKIVHSALDRFFAMHGSVDEISRAVQEARSERIASGVKCSV